MTHPLQQVFDMAILQATKGKGERHGGDSIPFLEQPWVHYSKMHGRGFLTGQAAKKLEEAASTRQGEAFIQEALGAIVYISMAILEEKAAGHHTDRCPNLVTVQGLQIRCGFQAKHRGACSA